MIFPGNLTGPKFEEGDLLSFSFDGAELTLPALRLQKSNYTIDDACKINNFRGINTKDWNKNDDNQAEILLLLQHWTMEDSTSLDDIAACKLYVNLIEIFESSNQGNQLLFYLEFEKIMVDWHARNLSQNDEDYVDTPDHPTSANCYLGQSVIKPNLNWFVAQLPINPRLKPIQLVMIPINNRFVLMAHIKIESLHYAGRTNPYSDETLKQFERDLFADFLNHIRIDYSPELIAKIQTLKTKTPA